jgi:hypothetical protein
VAGEKRGVPRGVSILTKGGSLLPCRRGRITLHPPRELAAAAQHLIRLHDLRVAPFDLNEPQSPVFSRETWQRDVARAENREIAGVLERGLVSKQGDLSLKTHPHFAS